MINNYYNYYNSVTKLIWCPSPFPEPRVPSPTPWPNPWPYPLIPDPNPTLERVFGNTGLFQTKLPVLFADPQGASCVNVCDGVCNSVCDLVGPSKMNNHTLDDMCNGASHCYGSCDAVCAVICDSVCG